MSARADQISRGPFLTKSKFVLAVECPTKLKYASDKRYANHNDCNEFLKALAEAGHQVGALAKALLGAGTEVPEIDHDAAIARTNELMKSENALIFEAAFAWERCFIRVDLLEKSGPTLRIYEVKAKSFDPTKDGDQFFGKKGGVASEFKPYLYDVAFQRFVLRRARPELQVDAALVFVNKSAASSEPVLQRLRVQRASGRVSIERDAKLDTGKAARECLVIVPVGQTIDRIEAQSLKLGQYEFGFEEGINELVRSLDSGTLPPRLGQQCKSCEFRASIDDVALGKLDGRAECWSSSFGITAEQFQHGSILDLHSNRSVDKLVSAGKVLLKNLDEADLSVNKETERITLSQRHFFQSEEARGAILRPRHLREALTAAVSAARFPQHFIDFETARPALPFHAGRRPYEQVLFQFSHHSRDEHGHHVHADQFLHEEIGVFPNYSVLRALKAAIGADDGSVIHWWEHEKTVLSDIRRQLSSDQADVPDRSALIEFIDSLVGTTERSGRLLDIGRLVESTVFLPGTRGSSSLKKVLPALIAHSEVLQEKYSAPLYGAAGGMVSKNFREHRWIVRRSDGRIKDPYELLGERFADPDLAGADILEEDEVIADGGAAMIAYGLLELRDTSPEERANLRSQLLRYCELDTLAMVMAWEAIEDLARSIE